MLLAPSHHHGIRWICRAAYIFWRCPLATHLAVCHTSCSMCVASAIYEQPGLMRHGPPCALGNISGADAYASCRPGGSRRQESANCLRGPGSEPVHRSNYPPGSLRVDDPFFSWFQLHVLYRPGPGARTSLFGSFDWVGIEPSATNSFDHFQWPGELMPGIF